MSHIAELGTTLVLIPLIGTRTITILLGIAAGLCLIVLNFIGSAGKDTGAATVLSALVALMFAAECAVRRRVLPQVKPGILATLRVYFADSP